jgi:Flp pilus assembly protein TadG
MENKNLIYIVGGIAVIGIGYYMYKKRQATPKVSATPVAETKSEDDTAGVVAKPKMESSTATNPLQGKPVNPNAMEVAQGMPTTTATTPASTTTKLNNLEVEKRIFTACGIKPTGLFKERRNQWDNCKDRTKANLKAQGLISFDGMNTYSNMTSDFDISFR